MDGMGPFPLQLNVKRLKPHIAGLLAPLSAIIIFILQGPLKDLDWKEILSHKLDWPAIVAMIVVVLGIFYLIGELVLKRIYYNSSGVGVVRSGSTPTWYPFDELREVKLSQTSRQLRGGSQKTSRIKLAFQTGRVTISSGLYNRTQVQELVEILQARTPRKTQPSPDLRTSLKKSESQRNLYHP